MKAKLAIVDGTYYIFRAFFGIRQSLTNQEGLPTNAIFAFKNMLKKLLAEIQPDYYAIVFDSGQPSYRTEIYPQYKANREEALPELTVQFPYIFELVSLLGLPSFVFEGFEADDVIATIAETFRLQMDVVIVSADKDLTQMVDENIQMYDSMRSIYFTPAEVEKKFGVQPTQIADFLALVGDASDNIPGAKGIGKVSASKILNTYGSLENIKENLLQIKGSIGEKLQASWDTIEMSKQLTLIQKNLPLNLQTEHLQRKPVQTEKLQAFYQKLNFRFDELVPATTKTAVDQPNQPAESVDTNTQQQQQTPVSLTQKDYQLILAPEILMQYINAAQEQSFLCLDLETTSLIAWQASIVGVALYVPGLKPAYVPLSHKHTSITQLNKELVLEQIKQMIGNPAMTILGHNLKYEYAVLTAHGFQWNAKMEDTMLLSYLLFPDSNQHNLDAITYKLFGHKNIPIQEVFALAGEKLAGAPPTFDFVPIEQALIYAAEDVDATQHIYQKLKKQLIQHDLDGLYQTLELPLIPVLADMEKNGIKIDAQHFFDYAKILKQEIEALKDEIHNLAGEKFNVNSPQQLGEILFTKMQITDHKVATKIGFSTDSAVLEKLAPNHKIAAKMLQYRAKTKLVSTYLDALPKLMNTSTNRIHSSFNQTVAATGRLSSSNPNLQNIPIRGNEGKKVRQGFISEPKCFLLSADYSQIELRILAHLSEDKNLLQAFHQDHDIHQQTAAKIFHIDLQAVEPSHRSIAKAINYGIVYGMGPQRLAAATNTSMAEASAFIKAYFAIFAQIQEYKTHIIQQAQKNGWVETLMQRKRWLPDIESKNRRARGFAQRIAMNTPIQGSAADIIKKAMLNVTQRLKKEKLTSRLLLQVHDELVLEVPAAEKDTVPALVQEEMEHAIDLKVPLKVSWAIGKNWDEAHA